MYGVCLSTGATTLIRLGVQIDKMVAYLQSSTLVFVHLVEVATDLRGTGGFVGIYSTT